MSYIHLKVGKTNYSVTSNYCKKHYGCFVKVTTSTAVVPENDLAGMEKIFDSVMVKSDKFITLGTMCSSSVGEMTGEKIFMCQQYFSKFGTCFCIAYMLSLSRSCDKCGAYIKIKDITTIDGYEKELAKTTIIKNSYDKSSEELSNIIDEYFENL